MRYAVIANGVVENVILADPSFSIEGKTLVETDTADLNWTYDGQDFHPPAPPAPEVPKSITPLQARKALRLAGLKTAVDSYVATLPEEEREEWEYASEIRRDNTTLVNAAKALGLDDAGLDQLFISGKQFV